MPKIIIMTHAPQKTLGDPSSAAKLQKLLLEQYKLLDQEIEVKVIIDTGTTENEEAVKNLFGEMNYELIKKFNAPEGKKRLEQNISDADLIILYPTPHFLNLTTATLITDIMARSKKSGVISLVEYDYDILHQHNSKGFVNTVAGSLYVSTGIGEQCLGIYINEQSPSKENLFQRLHETDRAKLPRDLNQNEGLYFGYFNKIGGSKTGANPARFIAFAAHNSPEKKQVDVVIPLLPGGSDVHVENKIDALLEKKFMDDIKDFNKVVISYSHAGATRYFVYQKNEDQLVAKEIDEGEYETQKNDADKVIRVINPFPLHPQSMHALMETSKAVNLVTGDQSLSEALSLAKIPFYQAMSWKKKLYDSLTSFAQNYPILHEWLTKNANQSISPKELADFYSENQSKMQEEIQSLRSELIQKKNLAINIVDYINSLIGMSLLERYQFFIQNLINDFEFYTQREGRQKEKYLDRKALFSHIDFYLQSASTDDERNEIVAYFIKHIDDIFNLDEYDVMPLFCEINDKYPSLNFQLPFSIILNGFKKMTSTVAQFVLIKGEEQEITVAANYMSDYLNYLSWTSTLTSEEKRDVLESRSLNAFCYFCEEEKLSKDTVMPLLQMIKNESDKDILQQGLKILFTIPTYKAEGDTLEFIPSEPSIFFQLKEQDRIKVLSRILKNPQAKAILLEELFKAENPLCIDALNKEPVSTFVLRALFFEKATSDNSHSFFKPTLNETLLLQLLDTTDGDMQKIIQNRLQAISAENTVMCIPDYLNTFLSKQLEKVM
ncbi:hypothetical protein FOLKNPGA_03600 [Legionella sp. PC1000]|uniref:hypothetical protein n=1 Tax=Legionella sp. PC1000 TaxID=2746060 RepID=UPI0015FBE3F6|nr:hypothetical protein [Legionella sp. PC1000]QLZ70781.1 hypothetical protein FOLKNPGA_03600 [Legionella sp. PC1000]